MPRRSSAWSYLLPVLLSALVTGGVSAQHSAVFGGGPLYDSSTTVIPQMKQSGFTTIIFWSVHIYTNGDLVLNGTRLVSGGKYLGKASWPGEVASLKQSPTTVDRIEFSVGSAGVKDFENIESLIKAQGTGPTSILYRNFAALKTAIPGIDAIDFDDESNYDVTTTVAFSKMLASLGFRITLVPYNQTSFWSSVFSQVNAALPGTVDRVYLQLYAGGSRNDPATWNKLFQGLEVNPGLWCKHGSSCNTGDAPTDVERRMTAWKKSPGIAGGFLWLLDDMLRCQISYPVENYASAINRSVGVGSATLYGKGCGRGALAPAGLPAPGSTMHVDLTGAQASTTCLLLVSSAPASLALDPLGLTGCSAFVDPSPSGGYFFIVPGSTTPTGSFTQSIPIPRGITCRAYLQYLFAENGLNPANHGTTQGLDVVVQ